MDEEKSKVYVLVDEQRRIIGIDGGYTVDNIEDTDDWLLVDEGIGDRYNLCQSHYLDGPLMTEEGICRYKLVSGKPVLRTEAEIEADREQLNSSHASGTEKSDAERIEELEAAIRALLEGRTS